MEKTKDVGLEDVNVVDFVKPTEPEDKPDKIEDKDKEKKVMELTSFPWKDVSHVVIGPNGVSLVPTGYSDKFSMPNTDNSSHPTPGQAPTVLEYDIEGIVGSMNEAETLRGENKTLQAELASVRAELETVKTAQAEVPAEETPAEEPVAETPEVPPVAEAPVDDEKSKEEIVLEEKKDAVVAGEKIAVDHSEDDLADAMKLMQLAKKQNVL